MPKIKVRDGDCIASIAYRYNLLPETIWDDPANSELKSQRKDPNMLLAGDVVELRTKEAKEEEVSLGRSVQFRRKGSVARLTLQMQEPDGEPQAGRRYVADVDGELFSGETDEEGKINLAIPVKARQGTLLLDPGTEDEEEYPLDLGTLGPVSEISGVQARLLNLGFECGEVDGVLGPLTTMALQQFQKMHGLPVTGEPDQATQQQLLEVHGC